MSDEAARGMIWAVVPVNDFARAKSRLAGALDADGRAKLARALCQHVLRVLCASPAIDGVLVLTPSNEVARLARARGAQVAMDPQGGHTPLGELVDAALARLARSGVDAAIVLMSDLPRLQPADVSTLATWLEHSDVVVAPDRHEQGTNALALRLSGRTSTCFGNADSFSRHMTAAAEAGRVVEICRSSSLALDVDLPDDLAELRGPSGTPTSSPSAPAAPTSSSEPASPGLTHRDGSGSPLRPY
jgi:2-phospho-L-lactate guanylyltransferase